jgi:hypothetical protein
MSKDHVYEAADGLSEVLIVVIGENISRYLRSASQRVLGMDLEKLWETSEIDDEMRDKRRAFSSVIATQALVALTTAYEERLRIKNKGAEIDMEKCKRVQQAVRDEFEKLEGGTLVLSDEKAVIGNIVLRDFYGKMYEEFAATLCNMAGQVAETLAASLQDSSLVLYGGWLSGAGSATALILFGALLVARYFDASDAANRMLEAMEIPIKIKIENE